MKNYFTILQLKRLLMMDEKETNKYLKLGNRKTVTDFYVEKNISDEPNVFNYNVFVRLNAKGKKFVKVSFQHCIFDNCYMHSCVFDTCDFTGCKFIGSNFHQTAFTGCDFTYATFERSNFDQDILSEAPNKENLRMHFARSMRMNFQQIGNSVAANRAITLELEATSIYLYKSWLRSDTYFKEKYSGFNILIQFYKWIEFWLLDFIWGNGESILKLLRTMLFVLIGIAIYDTNISSTSIDFNIGFYWTNFLNAPEIFLGLKTPPNFTYGVLSFITAIKFVSFALLTTLLIKRFSRR